MLLESRETILEQRLASVRALLNAYADEDRRLCWNPNEAEQRAVRAASWALAEEEASVVRELVAVRDELVARGHRKVIVRPPASRSGTLALLTFAVVIAAYVAQAWDASAPF